MGTNDSTSDTGITFVYGDVEGYAIDFPLFLQAYVVCSHAPDTSEDCEVVESQCSFLSGLGDLCF